MQDDPDPVEQIQQSLQNVRIDLQHAQLREEQLVAELAFAELRAERQTRIPWVQPPVRQPHIPPPPFRVGDRIRVTNIRNSNELEPFATLTRVTEQRVYYTTDNFTATWRLHRNVTIANHE